MRQSQMTLNALPVRTWEWLGVNESRVDGLDAADGSCKPEAQLPVAGAVLKQAAPAAAFGGGMGEETDAWFAAACGKVLQLHVNGAETEKATVLYNYDNLKHCCDCLEIYAGAGSSVTVLQACTSAHGASGTAAVQTKIHAAANARVKLVQVQLLGEGFRHLNDVGALLEAGAALEVVQLELGGAEVYSGALADLAGAGSSAAISTGYLGSGTQQLDLSHIALHRGKKTRSLLTAGGALRGRAYNLYRAPIDLQNGASGSEGEEQENVLLLNEGVVNKTIPLILCNEEDVQGNHGATIGRLDGDLLFYLGSRGFTEKEAADMMARARLDAFCRQIDDEHTVGLIREFLEDMIADAG